MVRRSSAVALVFLAILAITQSAAAQDVAPILEGLRPTYPTPMTKAHLSDMLNRAASQRPGWGMLRKDAGNNCPTPYPGISISCDWMVYGPTRWGYDILSDQENAARVVRGDGEALGAGMEIVYPWPTEAPPTPPVVVPPPPVVVPPPVQPPVVVPPVAVDLAPVLERLDALAAQLVAHDERLQRHDESPSYFTKIFGNRYVQMALAGVGTWLGQKAAK